MRKFDYFVIMFIVLSLTLGVIAVLSSGSDSRRSTPLIWRVAQMFFGTAVQDDNVYQQSYVSNEPIIRATSADGTPQIDHSIGW